MKSTLISGTLILAGAAFFARFLGVIQRIPLQRLLEDLGMASYAIAYNIYFWLLVLATAGFPSAIAKLVSEKYAMGLHDEGEAIRRTAARFSLVTGLIAAILVFSFSSLLAQVSGNPDAALAIRALAPALLLFPWIAVERGYFHGRQKMLVNGLSQIWEQIFRVITAIALAYFMLEYGYGLDWAAAGASFGGVLGSVAAAGVILYYGFTLRRHDRKVFQVKADDVLPRNKIKFVPLFRSIVKLAIPVSVTALAVPTIYLIDSLLTIPLLRDEQGIRMATETLGILGGRAQSLAGIPVIFAIALSQSILPIIAFANARNDQPEVVRQTSLALRIAIITGAPVIVILSTSIFSLNTFIFGDAHGSWVIVSLLVSVLFQIVMMTTGSVLLGLGRADLPMKHIAIGIVLKLGFTFLLAPFIGIYGIISATAICFAATAVLNALSLKRLVQFQILGSRALPFVGVILLQSGIGASVSWLLYHYFQPFGLNTWDAFIQTILASGFAVMIYPLLLFKLRIIGSDDIRAMPESIRNKGLRFLSVFKKYT